MLGWNEQHKDLFSGQTKGRPAGLKITLKLRGIKSWLIKISDKKTIFTILSNELLILLSNRMTFKDFQIKHKGWQTGVAWIVCAGLVSGWWIRLWCHGNIQAGGEWRGEGEQGRKLFGQRKPPFQLELTECPIQHSEFRIKISTVTTLARVPRPPPDLSLTWKTHSTRNSTDNSIIFM